METAQLGLILFDDDNELTKPVGIQAQLGGVFEQVKVLAKRVEQMEKVQGELVVRLRTIISEKSRHQLTPKQQQQHEQLNVTTEQALMSLDKKIHLLTSQTSKVLQELRDRLGCLLNRMIKQQCSQSFKLPDSTSSDASFLREQSISRLNDKLTATKRHNQLLIESFTGRIEAVEQQLHYRVNEFKKREECLKLQVDSQAQQIVLLSETLKQERERRQEEQPVFAVRNQNQIAQPTSMRIPHQICQAKIRVQKSSEGMSSPKRREPISTFVDGSLKSIAPSQNKQNCSRTRRKKIFGEASSTNLQRHTNGAATRQTNAIEELVSPIRKGIEDSHLTETEHLWALDRLEDFHQENVLDGSEEDVFFYPEHRPEQSDSELVINERQDTNALQDYQIINKQEGRSNTRPLSPNFYSPFDVGHRQ